MLDRSLRPEPLKQSGLLGRLEQDIFAAEAIGGERGEHIQANGLLPDDRLQKIDAKQGYERLVRRAIKPSLLEVEKLLLVN
jgi:hypothetical protein